MSSMYQSIYLAPVYNLSAAGEATSSGFHRFCYMDSIIEVCDNLEVRGSVGVYVGCQPRALGSNSVSGQKMLEISTSVVPMHDCCWEDYTGKRADCRPSAVACRG